MTYQEIESFLGKNVFVHRKQPLIHSVITGKLIGVGRDGNVLHYTVDVINEDILLYRGDVRPPTRPGPRRFICDFVESINLMEPATPSEVYSEFVGDICDT